MKFIFDQLGIKNPSFLDIGAHHPYYLSNTALLYELGSTGINIEPDPFLFKEFLKIRKNDTNLNIGISDKKGFADFYEMNVKTLNTFSKEEAYRVSEEGNYYVESVKQIQINTLEEIISDLKLSSFPNFLNIDAEGIDELIVSSIDYKNKFPIVICIETMSFSTNRKGVKNQFIIDFLKKNSYIIYADTHINTIFVHNSVWK